MTPSPHIRTLGLIDYATCMETMREAVAHKDEDSTDELWVLQHPRVITLGIGADPAHIQPYCNIPVVRSSRGGQVTCHAPGQLVIYTLLNLHRLKLGIRSLVTRLEVALQEFLADCDISAQRNPQMPGVYVAGRKIASIGLRISRGQSSHGLALNVSPDLSLFRQFDICGDPKLQATSLHECGCPVTVEQAAQRLIPHLIRQLYAAPENS